MRAPGIDYARAVVLPSVSPLSLLSLPLLLQASPARPAPELPGGYGAALFQSLLALVLVCVLAWVLLRFFAGRGVGLGVGRRAKILERVPLDARRALVLVELGDHILVLGVGDGAAPTLIEKLPKDALPEPEARRTFLEAWKERRRG